MNKFITEGTTVIHIWMGAILIGGMFYWYLGSQNTQNKSVENSMIISGTLYKMIDFFNPSPIILWLIFITVLIIAIIITFSWVNQKYKKK